MEENDRSPGGCLAILGMLIAFVIASGFVATILGPITAKMAKIEFVALALFAVFIISASALIVVGSLFASGARLYERLLMAIGFGLLTFYFVSNLKSTVLDIPAFVTGKTLVIQGPIQDYKEDRRGEWYFPDLVTVQGVELQIFRPGLSYEGGWREKTYRFRYLPNSRWIMEFEEIKAALE